jgi:hypothetical protein
MMEVGILFHSVIIGVGLGVITSSIAEVRATTGLWVHLRCWGGA